MPKPVLHTDRIRTLLDTPFIRVHEIPYGDNRRYFDASRRRKEDLPVMRDEISYRRMLPDAVTLVVILRGKDGEDRLLLAREFRYPAGQFLLSPPAGLLDPEDRDAPDPLLSCARRELKEETGLEVRPGDTLRILSPLLFSTPGLSDESNALVLAHLRDTGAQIAASGASGSECFEGFCLLNREEARSMLRKGLDDRDMFYSVYTFAALSVFCLMASGNLLSEEELSC